MEPTSPLSSPAAVLDAPFYIPRTLKITVYQDPSNCWCAIGEREMQRALRTLQEREEDVQVTWEFKPFVVDPTLSCDTPVNSAEYWCQKYGAHKWGMMEQLVSSRGAGCGIDFKFGGPMRSPLMSNRLIMRAHQLGGGEAQKALIEEINKRVFEQQCDIGCPAVLSESAAAAGLMCREQAIAFLISNKLEEEVSQEMQTARQRGITGVPFTVLNDKWAISGGQPAETYLQAFTQVLQGEATPAP